MARQAKEARLAHALSTLQELGVLWEETSLSEKRTLASYIIESLKFEPDGQWVNVRLKLILSEQVLSKIPRRDRRGRGSDGIDSLSRMELATASYCLQGHSDEQIAADRDVSLAAVRSHRASLIRRTGADHSAQALEMAAPVVEARKDELLLGWRRGRHFREHFADYQIGILKILSEAYSAEQIAEKHSRSVGTIHGALHKICARLGVHSARDAVAEARRRRLIPGTSEFDRRTPNQSTVLELLDAGRSQPEAADQLGTTTSALKTRVRCMFDKFGKRTQYGVLELAHESGWLT